MPAAGDESPFSANDPKARARRAKPRSNDEAAEVDAPDTTPAGVFDPDKDLPGAVFMVPNRYWGFEGSTSDDHPGACAHYQESARQAILVKGTDAENVRSPRRFYFVAPAPGNGLSKETAFELVPRYFRLHRIRLFYPERHLGWLDDANLHGLCDELARLHPEE
jgi:hypothetical protein